METSVDCRPMINLICLLCYNGISQAGSSSHSKNARRQHSLPCPLPATTLTLTNGTAISPVYTFLNAPATFKDNEIPKTVG